MTVRVHGGIFDNQTLQGGLRYFDIEEANMTVDVLGDAGIQLAGTGEITILLPGTGHAAADILTFTGGTFSTFPTITIDSVGGGGEIITFSISEIGTGTVLPSNPITVTTSGSGSPLTALLEVNLWSSKIIIPNAGTQAGFEHFVPYLKAVIGSAVDQVLNEVATYGTIVQIAIVDADTVRVVLENDSMAWDQPGGGDAEADMETAIQALGTVNVPDTSTTGGTFDLSAATVTERSLAAFAP